MIDVSLHIVSSLLLYEQGKITRPAVNGYTEFHIGIYVCGGIITDVRQCFMNFKMVFNFQVLSLH